MKRDFARAITSQRATAMHFFVCHFSSGLLVSFLVTCAGLPASANVYARNAAIGQNSTQEEANAELRNAAALLRAGKLDEAEKILRHVATNARNADAHNLLGVTLDQQGKAAEAEREFRTALRINANAVSPLTNLGVLLARTQRSDEAIKTFESVLRLSPDHPEATLNLGLQYASRGEPAKAASLLEKAIKLGLDGYDVRFHLGVALYQLKRFDEAANALESAASISPSAAEPFYFLGLLASTRGDDEAASQYWQKALRLRPNYPEPNFMLGELSAKRLDYAAAKTYYEQAWRQDPTQPVYHVRLGGVYLLLGNFNQALDIFQSAAEHFPAIAQIHYFTAIAARGTANFDLALIELHKALVLQPNSADALALSGAINFDRGNIADAEKLLRRALTFNQQHFNSLYDLGRLLVKTNRYVEALPLLERAAEINSNSPEVHYQIFLALSRLKRKTDADREFEIYKQLLEKEKMQKPDR